MSTALFGYLEAQNPTSPTSWTCITHQDQFDGVSFKNRELLPDITYPIDTTNFKSLTKPIKTLQKLSADQLSPKLQTEYHNLSKDVTGDPNRLTIYSLNLSDLINTYNQLIDQPNIHQKLFTYITSLIRKLANSYYFQINVAGDPFLLNPDQQHKIELHNPVPIRLVAWLDN